MLHGKLHLEAHDEHVHGLHPNREPILLSHLQEAATRAQQEAEEQLEELQQQLQEQLLAAGSLTERVLSAEASSRKVSMPAFTWHPFPK